MALISLAIDYKNTKNIKAEIAAVQPDGVNCYFDNTCGPISDSVFEYLALGARITVCFTSSLQEWEPIPQGPRIKTINYQTGSDKKIFDTQLPGSIYGSN